MVVGVPEGQLSGETVGSSKLGTCRGQWLQPPGPGRTSQSHVKPDPVQTSADKFGISMVEVTPLRDTVVKRKELNQKSVILS